MQGKCWQHGANKQKTPKLDTSKPPSSSDRPISPLPPLILPPRNGKECQPPPPPPPPPPGLAGKKAERRRKRKKNLRNHQSGIFLGSLTANDDAALTANGRRTTNLSFPPRSSSSISVFSPLLSFLFFTSAQVETRAKIGRRRQCTTLEVYKWYLVTFVVYNDRRYHAILQRMGGNSSVNESRQTCPVAICYSLSKLSLADHRSP